MITRRGRMAMAGGFAATGLQAQGRLIDPEMKYEPIAPTTQRSLVAVRQGETDRVLRMSKHEAADLRPEDEVWVLDTWYEDNLRPAQFRLTPLRILLEYPFLLLLPAGLALWRLRRARQQAEAAPPPPVRRTFTDDFHLRAQRFAKPQPPEEPGSPPPDAP